MQYLDKYKFWLENECTNKEEKDELRAIADNSREIEDRFYKDLEFGTGGLRGKIGMGTNRMNIYTVSRATQGLADYILEKEITGTNQIPRIIIAYDSRHKSPEFAKTSALVLAANNIRVFLFDNLRPTPELSFAVRYLKASAGIVITASHNPSDYNGYKVYGPDGGQIIPEIADHIISRINKIKDCFTVKKIDEKTALKEGLLKIIGEEIDDIYIRRIKELTLRNNLEIDRDIKIVYTPLHGSGNIPVRRILKVRGFTSVHIVKEQADPDPDFSTVSSPNPEDPGSFKLALALGRKVNAEIIIATDPDCDRIGLAVRYNEGQSKELISTSMQTPNYFTILTGNQVGALLLEYILSTKKQKNTLPINGVIIKTIVTSELGRVIAGDYNLETIDTLTGFKFICHKIKEMEEEGDKKFIFGYEESVGYLAGEFVRDKDAVIASMLICEMAAYYHKNGLNILQVLENLYKKYGYYIEGLESITLEGAKGEEKMNVIMDDFRQNTPQAENMPIARINDYLKRESYDCKSKTTTPIDLPQSDVYKVIFSDNSWYVLRPSGTEPKIKIYFSFNAKTKEEANKKLSLVKSTILKKIQTIIKPV